MVHKICVVGAIRIGTNQDDDKNPCGLSGSFNTQVAASKILFWGQKWPKLVLKVTFSAYFFKFQRPLLSLPCTALGTLVVIKYDD